MFHHPLIADLSEVRAPVTPRPKPDKGHDEGDGDSTDADRKGIHECIH